VEDVSQVFQKHVRGEMDSTPWSEADDLNPETSIISSHLEKLIGKGWWTVASQPAVNGQRSDDKLVGWGPKGGLVFQKPFVEFFIPDGAWRQLREKLDKHLEVTYFAANAKGAFVASDEAATEPVTWGAFPGKE
jgi:methylenetetrahydrofolate reductase (NADPH)